jgi:hypothetical protein
MHSGVAGGIEAIAASGEKAPAIITLRNKSRGIFAQAPLPVSGPLKSLFQRRQFVINGIIDLRQHRAGHTSV